MENRLLLIFLLVFHLNLIVVQASRSYSIDFTKSDYDYEGCGKPGKRAKTRVKRSDYTDYDGEDDDTLQEQGFGGTSARNGDTPWAVALMIFSGHAQDTYHLCAGTLISRRHVISAAHCLHDHRREFRYDQGGGGPYCDKSDHYDYNEYVATTKVLVDGPCLKEQSPCTREMVGKKVDIANITVFPFFQSSCEEGDDFMIITLKREVESNHACLPWLHDIVLPPQMEVESFGWGESRQTVIENGFKKIIGNNYEIQMQRLALGKTDLECKLSHSTYILDKICVPEKDTVANCKGDSGAGLLTTLYRKTYLLGVLSLGSECETLNERQHEAKFTDIRLFQASINKAIRAVGPYPD